ncbi:MAG: uracil phosphoribosyltransferase [Syntrophomonadaceae bacterium]|jgi:uracil phosphoribosyltransferase
MVNRVQVIDHPLAGNALRTLRNRDSQIKSFREALNSLGLLLAVETCRELEVQKDQVFTPLDTPAECSYVDDTRILLVPVLRAGLGFVESFLALLPAARVAHVGVYRDHDTLEARPYLNTVPEQNDQYDRVIVLDPMLATGNSGVKTLEFIMEKGYKPSQVMFVCALAVRQGIEQIHGKYPQVQIVTAAIDPSLNDKAYIVPGLGDAGDRLYLL